MRLLQKLFAFVIMFAALLWALASIAAPLISAIYGGGVLASILSSMSSRGLLVVLVLGAIGIALRFAGVLPPPRTTQAPAVVGWSFSGWRFTIIVTLLIVASLGMAALVAFAPPFQSNKRLADAVIGVFPMILLLGVWLYVLSTMKTVQKQKDTDDEPPDAAD